MNYDIPMPDGETGGRILRFTEPSIGLQSSKLCLPIFGLPFCYPALIDKQSKQDNNDYYQRGSGNCYRNNNSHCYSPLCCQNSSQYRPPKTIISSQINQNLGEPLKVCPLCESMRTGL